MGCNGLGFMRRRSRGGRCPLHSIPVSKAQRGGQRPKPAPAVSIKPAPSPRPVFGLKRISSCREAGLVFSPNPETSGESTCPTVYCDVRERPRLVSPRRLTRQISVLGLVRVLS